MNIDYWSKVKWLDDRGDTIILLIMVVWLYIKCLMHDPTDIFVEDFFDFWTVMHFVAGIAWGRYFKIIYSIPLPVIWEFGEWLIDPNMWQLNCRNNVLDVAVAIPGIIFSGRILSWLLSRARLIYRTYFIF